MEERYPDLSERIQSAFIDNIFVGEDKRHTGFASLSCRIIFRMDFIPDKVMLNIHCYGNTTAATIPLCLWDFKREINKDDLIVLAAFGGEFT